MMTQACDFIEIYALNHLGLDLLRKWMPPITDVFVHTTRPWTMPKQMLMIFTGTFGKNLATRGFNNA